MMAALGYSTEMALTKLATDGVIAGWKTSHRLEQTAWRRPGRVGNNYGQVLRGGGRPSDQPLDGPGLPLNPEVKADARIDVYESPDGFGWLAIFEAVENPGAVRWFRTVGSFMDEPLVESVWSLVPASIIR
jgi:hypothetical protein